MTIGFSPQTVYPGFARNYDNVQVPTTPPALSSATSFDKALYYFAPGSSWNGGVPAAGHFPGERFRGIRRRAAGRGL